MPLIPLFYHDPVESGDAPADRMSAFNFCNPFDHILPFHDGTVSVLDRGHLLGLYSGIQAGSLNDAATTAYCVAMQDAFVPGAVIGGGFEIGAAIGDGFESGIAKGEGC